MAKNGNFSASGIMEKFKDGSFLMMILFALLSFLGFGMMEYAHYAKIFSSIADGGYATMIIPFIVPIIMQGGRFSFLLATAVSVEKKHGIVYWIVGGLITLAFSLFQSYEASEMSAEIKNTSHSDVIFYLSMFLIWVGLAIEVRLVMLLND